MKNNRIIYYPDYSSGNPYQKLLYQPCKEANWLIETGSIKDALKILEQEKYAYQLIFHIHWLNALFKDCKSDFEAWQAVGNFLLDITKFKSSGGKIIWTIHNHLPHENKFSEQDLRVRHFLCKHADRIHLHCGSHLQELDYLPIDIQKVAIHRHGNYINYYGQFNITERLNSIQKNGPSALFVGMLRGYKSIDSLLETAKSCIKSNIPVTIAGKPESTEISIKIEKFSEEFGIQTILRRLTESEIHHVCSEHNIGILSYDKILTSGTLKLYLSYGMSILSPMLSTIKSEDRFQSFIYTTREDNTSKNIAKELSSITRESLQKASKTNYFLAQEARWSLDLFQNITIQST